MCIVAIFKSFPWLRTYAAATRSHAERCTISMMPNIESYPSARTAGERTVIKSLKPAAVLAFQNGHLPRRPYSEL